MNDHITNNFNGNNNHGHSCNAIQKTSHHLRNKDNCHVTTHVETVELQFII